MEYYFGDDNLPTDRHLLELCGGSQNLPVRLSEILRFKKMRQFKPKGKAIASLRKSAHLDVSEDGKTIKRKIPLRGPTVLDKDQDSDSDLETPKPAEAPKPPKAPQPPKQAAPAVDKSAVSSSQFEGTFRC